MRLINLKVDGSLLTIYRKPDSCLYIGINITEALPIHPVIPFISKNSYRYIMLNKLRPRLQRFIDPLAKKININPNVITLIGFLVSLLSAYAFAQGNLLYGGILIAVSGFFDIIDGAVARNHGKQTKFGGILDSTVDRFSDAFILIGIVYGGFAFWLWGILALHASLSVSYVRARAEVDGVKCDVGVAERAERLFILMAGAFLGYFIQPDFMTGAVILIMLLGYITVAQRLYHSWKELKE